MANEHSHTNVEAKPNCYECKYRRDLAGDCHSTCANKEAKVTGHAHGIRMGWFFWPYNFDPTWLVNCDGFAAKAPVSDEDVNHG